MRDYTKNACLLFLTACAVFYNAMVKAQEAGRPHVLPGPVGPFVVHEPTSRDCKEHEKCTMHDGTEGFCEQIYCGVGKKCFTCRPGTGPGYI